MHLLFCAPHERRPLAATRFNWAATWQASLPLQKRCFRLLLITPKRMTTGRVATRPPSTRPLPALPWFHQVLFPIRDRPGAAPSSGRPITRRHSSAANQRARSPGADGGDKTHPGAGRRANRQRRYDSLVPSSSGSAPGPGIRQLEPACKLRPPALGPWVDHISEITYLPSSAKAA